MAAPQFDPVEQGTGEKSYSSPPRRPDSWMPDRPAEVIHGAHQPDGASMGSQGPDQGYALKLARTFEGTLELTEREDEHDALKGCLGVALKRASLYSRAPVIHDLRLALALFGFIGPEPDAELVAFRRPRFEGLANPHHYVEARALVDLVPESTLRLTPDQVLARRAEWRTLLGL